MKRRIFSILLSFCIIAAMMPAMQIEAHASGAVNLAKDPEGTLVYEEDNHITYSYDASTKTLTLSGAGVIPSYSYGSGDHPFEGDDIEHLVISEGITKVGAYLLYNCHNLKSVSIPSTLSVFGGTYTNGTALQNTGVGEGGFTVAEDNEYLCADDGCLYNKDKTLLYKFGGSNKEYKTPSTLKIIANSAFDFCTFDTLTLGGNGLYAYPYGISDVETKKLILEEGFVDFGDSGDITLTEDFTVTLPASYSGTIDTQGLLNSATIQGIKVASGNEKYEAVDGILLEKSTGYVVTYPRGATRASYITNKKIKGFKKYAFGVNNRNTNLKALTLSENVSYMAEKSINITLKELVVENRDLVIYDGIFNTGSAIYLPQKITASGTSEAYYLAEKHSITHGAYSATLTYGNTSIAGLEKEYKYTGTAIEPELVVMYGAMELKKGTDYTVSYVNNTAKGTATVKITPCGEFKTSTGDPLTYNFTITDKCLHKNMTTRVTKKATCKVAGQVYHECPDCDVVGWYETVPALGHDIIHCDAKEPNCTENGCYAYDKCSRCNYSTYVSIKKLGHDIQHHEGKEATCTEAGWEAYDTCSRCDYTTYKEIPATGHTYSQIITRAVPGKAGKIEKECECGALEFVKEIKSPKTITLSPESYTYSGSAKKPAVTVKDTAGKVISSENYTVKYTGNTKVGKATATVTFKGDNYSGSLTKTFKINPKGTAISSVTAAKKAFTVKWKKQTTQTTGYQVRYSTKSSMAGAKTVTVSKNTTLSKTISKLTAKKTYYVQVRTYTSLNGTKYYSSWSTKKSIKTK